MVYDENDVEGLSPNFGKDEIKLRKVYKKQMKECSVLVGQGKNSFSNTADKKMNLSIRHKTNLTISTEGEKGRKKEGSSPSVY